MRVGIYARVSTSDQNQEPETQLMPLRDYCAAQGWDVVREYIDQSPANDLARRTQWRSLLDDASKKRFDLLEVNAHGYRPKVAGETFLPHDRSITARRRRCGLLLGLGSR